MIQTSYQTRRTAVDHGHVLDRVRVPACEGTILRMKRAGPEYAQTEVAPGDGGMVEVGTGWFGWSGAQPDG